MALTLVDLVAALRDDGWAIVTVDEAYTDPLTAESPDVPFAQGTITEMVAWERNLPSPRWYHRNNTDLAREQFERRVLGVRNPEIPERFRGVWDYELGTCAHESDLRLEIGAGGIVFYESFGTVTAVRIDGGDTIVELSMEGEGENWEQTLHLSQSGRGAGRRLHVSDGSQTEQADELPRKRCE